MDVSLLENLVQLDEMPEEEDKLKLCECESRGRTIATGATYTLIKIGRPGLELTVALLAGCLLTLLVIILTLVPVIRALEFDDSCRSEDAPATKVYFVKHEDRRWTSDELCWIEIAARRYPQFDIFMINLRKNEGESLEGMSDVFIEELFGNELTSSSGRHFGRDNEADLRLRLLEIPNVRNVDVSVDKFFAGSILLKMIKNLTSEQIELAAKFQVVWNSPGISLEPGNIAQLESVQYFFDDQIDTSASVQIDDDLQAASVPCQSFIGLVISEMTKAFDDRRTILTRAISNFCPRFSRCAGVRIMETKRTRFKELAECPIVYPDDNS